MALFYLALDDFKGINDTQRHMFGDRLLREVDSRLEQDVSCDNLVARLGGDDFAVVVVTSSGDGMLIECAHRFLSILREPFEIDGQTVTSTARVGVARCSEETCEADELMRRADLALEAAKEKGRDHVARLGDPSCAQRNGRMGRRFRNRLFLAQQSAPLPARPDQDRSRVRQGSVRQRSGTGDRLGDHHARRCNGNTDHRRGGRTAQAAQSTAQAGPQRGAGLSHPRAGGLEPAGRSAR